MIFKSRDKVIFMPTYGTLKHGTVITADKETETVIISADDEERVYEVPAQEVRLDYKAMEPKNDNVNHPKHYSSKPDGIETIKIVDHMVMGLKPRAAVRVGNATKYMDRFMAKNGKEDIKKAIWYLQDYVDHYEEYNER